MANKPATPIKLYRFPLSGHSHRAELQLNTFGQVPVLDDNGTVIPDSNAILVYLARRYGGESWLPGDPVGAAAVQRWLSVAAGPIAFGPARARLITVFGANGLRIGASERQFHWPLGPRPEALRGFEL